MEYVSYRGRNWVKYYCDCVTNGVINTPPSDVATSHIVWIFLEPEIAEVWGKVCGIIISSGWSPVPGFLFPGLFSLLLLSIVR